MRLIKLEANQPSFHTVHFNSRGLSIIVGKKEDKNNTNTKNTYNSVGKSLLIRIVHFCLGANTIDEFEAKLPGWEFVLTFDIEGERFQAIRATSKQDQILVNGQKTDLTTFRDKFQKLLFKIDDPVPFLKFRPLISRFIRPMRASYETYEKFVPKEQEYAQNLCNGFLLGLDPFLFSRKHDLKNELDDVQKLEKNISKDSIFRQFFEDGKNVEVEIVNLEQYIIRLESRIKQFVIAEDYGALKRQADDLSAQLREKRNRITLLRNTIKNIEKSQQIQPDISKEQLLNFYEEAKISLGELVVKRLEEVDSFHQKLVTDRIRRLESEKRKFLSEQKELESEVQSLGKLEDEKLQLLNSSGALEDYKALNEELANLKTRLNKLKTYKELLNQYQIKRSELEIAFQQENIASINYLAKEKGIIDANISMFKGFAQEFYEDKVAGIEISNDDGRNQRRFNIAARIQDDAGDGVNQVKLFCFDFTLLKGQHNHKVQCLFHDSRLLSEMDPRQRAGVFRVAYEECLNNGFQYIISINEDLLDSIQPYFSQEEFSTILGNNIVLELTDRSSETKLLGIQVDMDYEK